MDQTGNCSQCLEPEAARGHALAGVPDNTPVCNKKNASSLFPCGGSVNSCFSFYPSPQTSLNVHFSSQPVDSYLILYTFYNSINLAGVLTMILHESLPQKSALIPSQGMKLSLYRGGGAAVCAFYTRRQTPFLLHFLDLQMVASSAFSGPHLSRKA